MKKENKMNTIYVIEFDVPLFMGEYLGINYEDNHRLRTAFKGMKPAIELYENYLNIAKKAMEKMGEGYKLHEDKTKLEFTMQDIYAYDNGDDGYCRLAEIKLV